MRAFVLGASMVAATVAYPSPNVKELFNDFMAKYDRQYATEKEKDSRFKVFSDNIEFIYATNAKNHSYTVGITSTTDQTYEEWRAHRLSGFKPPLTMTKDRDVFKVPAAFVEPDSIDWVAKGGVTSVKNQGTCGSCWTFSTVGALEGAMFVAGRPLVELSMQHILACDTDGDGCGGGQMDQAFDWVAKNGVPSLKEEPYLCKNKDDSQCASMKCSKCAKQTGETCFFGQCHKYGAECLKFKTLINHCVCPEDKCFADGACGEAPAPANMVLAAGDVTKHTDVDATEGALEAAVAQQPVSVAIEADQMVFQHYTGGVLTDDACGSKLDHGVLAVGYGVDNGQKYWKLKNSWDTVFGEDGYIRIAKGSAADGGECGIRKMASFPTVKSAMEEVVV